MTPCRPLKGPGTLVANSTASRDGGSPEISRYVVEATGRSVRRHLELVERVRIAPGSGVIGSVYTSRAPPARTPHCGPKRHRHAARWVSRVSRDQSLTTHRNHHCAGVARFVWCRDGDVVETGVQQGLRRFPVQAAGPLRSSSRADRTDGALLNPEATVVRAPGRVQGRRTAGARCQPLTEASCAPWSLLRRLV